jgi:hypothetical protein
LIDLHAVDDRPGEPIEGVAGVAETYTRTNSGLLASDQPACTVPELVAPWVSCCFAV